jgi:membrane associated rhomboid family serine protease
MVFPLFDDNTDRRTTPFLNYVIIIVNVAVFVFLQGMGDQRNRFTRAFSLVPDEILTGEDVVTEGERVRDPVSGEVFELPGLAPTPVPVYFTFLTSIFMHGSWAHLLGNMLFLWIFGDNVEDYLGHVRYIFFYLVCGILASAAHIGSSVAFDRNLDIPTLGASGAISGVLGGYILLFPHRRVTVILFRFLTDVPAVVAIGLWFLFQIGYGVLSVGQTGGGVAYGAHIGGFIAGLALVKVFGLGAEPPRPADRPFRRYPTDQGW